MRFNDEVALVAQDNKIIEMPIPDIWREPSRGKLGFNLIVRNEEKVLEKCLKSIRPIADEIVVTDTGSTDSTPEIALKYADKVLSWHWRDDFSAARNFSLQFSTTKWICWIDGDEWIISQTIPFLKSAIENKEAVTIFCGLLSDLPDNRQSKHFLPKIFKRGTAHFEDIVHNQLMHAQPVLVSQVTFGHSGYNLSEDAMQKKRQRTISLLRRQLVEDENNIFAMMNLARTLMTSGELEESLETAERAIVKDGVTDSLKQMLLYNVAVCKTRLNQFDEAKKACWECLAINPENLDMVFILGWLACLRAEHAQAILYLKRYLDMRKEQEGVDFNLLILDFWDAQAQGLNFIGISHRLLGHFEQAAKSQTKAIEISPQDSMVWLNLVETYIMSGDADKAEIALQNMVDRGLATPLVWNNLAVSIQ